MPSGPRYPTATTRHGRYRQIFEGKADCTLSGLTKKDLKRNKSGVIVSKAKSTSVTKSRKMPLKLWRKALEAACEIHEVNYQIPSKGTELYKTAKELFDEYMED